MNLSSCPVVFCETPGAFDRQGAGALMVDEELLAGEQEGFIYLRLPCGTDCGALAVARNPATSTLHEGRYPVWKIEGDPAKPETLTIHPSIHLQGQWHGWLRAGKLESC